MPYPIMSCICMALDKTISYNSSCAFIAYNVLKECCIPKLMMMVELSYC